MKGADFSRAPHERRLRGDSPRELRAELKQSRRELRRAKRAATGRPAAAGANTTAAPHLEAIAACESGGDPSANTRQRVLPRQVPVHAGDVGSGRRHRRTRPPPPEAEQDKRAAMLYAQRGSSPWPVCGQ